MKVPLTPLDCDLSDFAFMPLDVARLRDSELASNETPEACWAAVLLWAASWHQIPAASIPNDDKWIARHSGAGRTWGRVRAAVMAGWVLCADGRFYHPEIARWALKAWQKKQVTARKLNRRLQIKSGEWAAIRAAVFERDQFKCTYCAARGVRLEADHVLAVSRCGSSTLDNLVTACKPCNRSKGAKLLLAWRQAA